MTHAAQTGHAFRAPGGFSVVADDQLTRLGASASVPESTVAPEILRQLESNDPAQKIRAVRLAGNLQQTEHINRAVPLLIEILISGTDDLRRASMQSLQAFGPAARAAHEVLEALLDADPGIAIPAATTIAATGHNLDRALKTLVDIFESPSSTQTSRINALHALTRFGEHAMQAEDLLKKLLLAEGPAPFKDPYTRRMTIDRHSFQSMCRAAALRVIEAIGEKASPLFPSVIASIALEPLPMGTDSHEHRAARALAAMGPAAADQIASQLMRIDRMSRKALTMLLALKEMGPAAAPATALLLAYTGLGTRRDNPEALRRVELAREALAGIGPAAYPLALEKAKDSSCIENTEAIALIGKLGVDPQRDVALIHHELGMAWAADKFERMDACARAMTALSNTLKSKHDAEEVFQTEEIMHMLLEVARTGRPDSVQAARSIFPRLGEQAARYLAQSLQESLDSGPYKAGVSGFLARLVSNTAGLEHEFQLLCIECLKEMGPRAQVAEQALRQFEERGETTEITRAAAFARAATQQRG